MKDELSRPWMRFPEFSGKSCWNCEHIRVGGMPNRECVMHSEKHIWSHVDPEEERRENGSVVAEECKDYAKYSIEADDLQRTRSRIVK